MLREYLQSQRIHQISWSVSMPGVQICHFSLTRSGRNGQLPIPVVGKPLHFEAFFCFGGRLFLHPDQAEPYSVETSDILLLSDPSWLLSCQCSPDLCGVLVAVDAKLAKDSFSSICTTMGMELDTRIVREKMISNRGHMVISGTSWSQALFQDLLNLSKEAQDRYCVFKAVELLYLLCSKVPVSHTPGTNVHRYVPQSILEATSYMQAHLGEKLTIPHICKQCSVSPTFLKEWFHRAYGVSVHSWLVEQRMKQAHKLICTSKLPIHQIAQAVGYAGISQFNATFKRFYGMTPSRLRKMSKTAISRPI